MSKSISVFVIAIFFFTSVSLGYAQIGPRYAYDLHLGLRNDSVAVLQGDLSADPSIYPEHLITGYFGLLTRMAVKRFQARHGIWQTGYVGPLTRAELNRLYAPIPVGWGCRPITQGVAPDPNNPPPLVCGIVPSCPAGEILIAGVGDGLWPDGSHKGIFSCSSVLPPGIVPSPAGEKIIRRVGDREGSFLIQKINANNIEGMWYQAYPVAMLNGTPKTLFLGDDIGYACEGVSEKLVTIDFYGQTITFAKISVQPSYGGCPRCLASMTSIDTPSGSMLVKDLRVGVPVWTMDAGGARVPGTIMQVSRVAVLPAHQMISVVLSDGRKLLISPGHPTSDGRVIGDLSLHESYDGASVASIERVPYGEYATYDILPSGDTGLYWANGIRIGSTLR